MQSYGGRGCVGSPPGEGIQALSAIYAARSINKASQVAFCANKHSSLALTTHTHTGLKKAHYRKCGFINNNSISFNEHCRYIIENKSETGETSSQES